MVSPVRPGPVTTPLVWAALVVALLPGPARAAPPVVPDGRSLLSAGLAPVVPTLATLAQAAFTDTAAAKCSPRGTTTIAQTRDVRVYRVRNGDVFGCHAGAQRPQRLVDALYENNADSWTTKLLRKPAVRISGRYVAFVTEWDSGVGAGTDVEVRDLLSRYGWAGEAEAPPLIPEDETTVGRVGDLELLPNGAVAWITTRSASDVGCTGADPSDDEDLCQVHAVTATGKRLLLDAGREIGPVSLQIVGATVEWMNAGSAKSKTLGLEKRRPTKLKAPRDGASGPCGSRGATIVYANRVGRFFRKRVRSHHGTHETRYYSCSYREGKKFRLVNRHFAPIPDRYGAFRVVGHFAAYTYQSDCPSCIEGGTQVLVQDLQTGRHRTFVNADGGRPYAIPTGTFQRVRDLELAPTGAVAWIVREIKYSGDDDRIVRNVLQVRAYDRHGARLLDQGAGIDPASLELHGLTIHWRRGAIERHAPLR